MYSLLRRQHDDVQHNHRRVGEIAQTSLDCMNKEAGKVTTTKVAQDTQSPIIAHMDAEVGGSILIRNEGGYVAHFEVTYTFNDKELTKKSGNFTLGVNKEIAVPKGATDIRLKVQEEWFISSWSTIFTETFSSPPDVCYKIYGTTLNPKYEPIDC